MKIKFLGTRGYIEARNRRHRMHSSILVSYHGVRVMVDCGEDWLGEVTALNPDAITLTHAHPDHAWGIKKGTLCPVYASAQSWKDLADAEVADQREMPIRDPIDILGIAFEAFPVDHSTVAPAVGYRITAGRACIFYVPDVVWINDRGGALQGARLYIGDGATIKRSMVRKPGNELIGHTPARTQLKWCQKEGVPKAIFTHCGSEIVKGDERTLGAELRRMARERHVEVAIAHDGMTEVLR
jgi:ribonuclease BN (tRNA processing enzyme)